MHIKQIKRFFIWSSDPHTLAQWYVDVLGLTKEFELDLPDDIGISLTAPEGGQIWIGYHDQVEGKNKDPYRFMISFTVDSVHQAYDEMAKKGVDFIAKPFETPTHDKYCATFQDPEGNLMQLFSPIVE